MSVYSVGGNTAGITGSAGDATGRQHTLKQKGQTDEGMSLGDFESLASALGLSKTQAAQDFKRWDTDGNGVLSNDELLKGLVGKSGTTSPLAQQFLRAIDGMKDLSLDGHGAVKPAAATNGATTDAAGPASTAAPSPGAR